MALQGTAGFHYVQEMRNKRPTAQPVKSALRTLDIIEYVVANDGAVFAQEIANALNVPLSSMSYLLGTLCDREYLVRQGRSYLPGPRLLRLRIPEESLPLETRLMPILRSLRAELNETVSIFGLDGWNAQVLLTEASDQALRYAIDPGERRPLHSLAGGKALLATLEANELDLYFRESHREKFTAATVTDEGQLRAELEIIKISGLAEAREESQLGISSLARSFTLKGSPVVAIGIAIPTVRFTEDLRIQAKEILLSF